LTVTSATVAGISPAYAGLLDDYDTDLNVDKQAEKKRVEQAKNKGKDAYNEEPNLQSNYYCPNNKGMSLFHVTICTNYFIFAIKFVHIFCHYLTVRYLPRIKKCSDVILDDVIAISNKEDWDAVRDFAMAVADDTILPMKLCTISTAIGPFFYNDHTHTLSSLFSLPLHIKPSLFQSSGTHLWRLFHCAIIPYLRVFFECRRYGVNDTATIICAFIKSIQVTGFSSEYVTLKGIDLSSTEVVVVRGNH